MTSTIGIEKTDNYMFYAISKYPCQIFAVFIASCILDTGEPNI